MYSNNINFSPDVYPILIFSRDTGWKFIIRSLADSLEFCQLPKVQWTFANRPRDFRHCRMSYCQKSNWWSSGNPKNRLHRGRHIYTIYIYIYIYIWTQEKTNIMLVYAKESMGKSPHWISAHLSFSRSIYRSIRVNYFVFPFSSYIINNKYIMYVYKTAALARLHWKKDAVPNHSRVPCS